VKKPVVLSDPETGKKELGIELGEVNFQHFEKGDLLYGKRLAKNLLIQVLGEGCHGKALTVKRGQKLVQVVDPLPQRVFHWRVTMPCLKTEGTRTIELLLIVVATACLSCSTVLQSEKDRKAQLRE